MKSWIVTYLPHPDNDPTTSSLKRAEITFTAPNYNSAESLAYQLADTLGASMDSLYEGG
jgi:hypothetical protein